MRARREKRGTVGNKRGEQAQTGVPPDLKAVLRRTSLRVARVKS
jgi:hypothetical protein